MNEEWQSCYYREDKGKKLKNIESADLCKSFKLYFEISVKFFFLATNSCVIFFKMQLEIKERILPQ